MIFSATNEYKIDDRSLLPDDTHMHALETKSGHWS